MSDATIPPYSSIANAMVVLDDDGANVGIPFVREASRWLDDYRKFARKPDNRDHSEHSGTAADIEEITSAIAQQWPHMREDLVKFWKENPELGRTFTNETQVANFAFYFRERVTQVYEASERRSRSSGERALHELHPHSQREVISLLSQDALKLAQLMISNGYSGSDELLARQSPVVYADFATLANHYDYLTALTHTTGQASAYYANAPRKAAREAAERIEAIQRSKPRHPSAGNVPPRASYRSTPQVTDQPSPPQTGAKVIELGRISKPASR